MSSFGESSGSNRGRRPTAANLVSRPQNRLVRRYKYAANGRWQHPTVHDRFRSGGNKKALRGVSLASHVALRSVSEVTWAVATLPGVLLALVACSAVIWLIYVKP
ncbi:hypothetical protein MRX96_018468 [Rhipicephalus microplus]